METKDILKTLRKSKGFANAKEFCDAADISFNTYQNYESGKRLPTAEILMQIADFYGVSTDYLLGREKTEPKKITPTDEELEMRILEAYRTFPEDARKDFLDRIREAVSSEQDGVFVSKTLGEIEDEHKKAEEEREKGGKFA